MKKTTLLKSMLLLCALVVGSTSVWAQAPVNTVLWSEDWTGGDTDEQPSEYGFEGTATYGGVSLTYSEDDTGTKLYSATLAGGTAPELLLKSGNKTWTISGIPTGKATEMTLSFKSNKTTFALTSSTDGISITGSGKSWTISDAKNNTTFNLTLKNTGSSNARIDDINLKVKTAGASGKTATSISVDDITMRIDDEIAVGDISWAESSSVPGSISYTSKNTSIANIEGGKLVAKTEGIATITASFTPTDTETYDVSYVDFTVTVIDPLAPKVTYDFANVDYGQSSLWTSTSTHYEGTAHDFDNGPVTLTADGRYRFWNSDKTLRTYAENSDYDAAELTFSVPAGSLIKKIVFSASANFTANTGTLSGTTWTGSANTVVFTANGGTNISTIAVTYEASKEVGPTGWATYVTPYAVEFADDEAFVVASVGSNVNLTSVTRVPANTPLLLKGVSTKITAKTLLVSPSAPATNLLAISDGTNGVGDYVLYNYSGTAGFYKWNGSALASGKVYLPKESVASARDFISLDEETTVITNVRSQKSDVRGEYFNLAGQRVAQPTKGLYIVNGKKVIIK